MRGVIANSIAATSLMLAAGHANASEEHSWRATVTSDRAMRIAGTLFPEKCGDSGERCGITYDDRRGCPFEFVVLFPRVEGGSTDPRIAIVTLDKHGAVLEVSSNKTKSCRSARS
jgi:hypothetical protein